MEFQGFAENATSPVPPGMFGHKSYPDKDTYDIDKAKMLKQESGIKSDVNVSLYYSESSKNLESIAAVLVRAGKKIGINIKKNPIPFSELVDIGYDTHDMLMMGWVGDIPDADVYLYPNFTEDSKKLNTSGYVNPELIKILKSARTTLDRKKEGKAVLCSSGYNFQRTPMVTAILYENHPSAEQECFWCEDPATLVSEFRNIYFER